MSVLLIKPPPESDASALLPLITQAEHEVEDEDDAAAALVLLDNGKAKFYITVVRGLSPSPAKYAIFLAF